MQLPSRTLLSTLKRTRTTLPSAPAASLRAWTQAGLLPSWFAKPHCRSYTPPA